MLNIKHTHIAGLILVGLLVGCGSSDNSEANEANEATEQIQEANENNIHEQTEIEENTNTSDQPIETPPPTVTTTNAKMFTADVMPILNTKCKSCHGSNGDFMITTPNDTYANISDLKASVTEAGKYLYDKGSNTVGHGGGEAIATTSAEYATIKSWVDAGADFN